MDIAQSKKLINQGKIYKNCNMQISFLARGQNQFLSQVCMLITDFWEILE